MCKKTNYKIPNPRIDKCMKELIENLEFVFQKIVNAIAWDEECRHHLDEDPFWKIVACCCGHKKYPMTIVAKDGNGMVLELCSGIYLKRKRNFYKRDKQGYYYIPETIVLEDV